MMVQRFYLITPKELLLSRLEGMDALSNDVLSHKHLWTSSEGGKSIWTRDDYMARIKLGFLINLKNESSSHIVASIFRDHTIATELFDTLWDIEILEDSNDLSELVGLGFDKTQVKMDEHGLAYNWIAENVLSRKSSQNK